MSRRGFDCARTLAGGYAEIPSNSASASVMPYAHSERNVVLLSLRHERHLDNRPSLETVLTTAVFYGLSEERGKQIVEEVATAVDGWEDVARKAGIARGDVELTAGAFSAHAEYRTTQLRRGRPKTSDARAIS